MALGFRRLSAAVVSAALLIAAVPAVAAPPANFAVENVLTGVEQPMAMRFLPDGRMLVALKKGKFLIVNVPTPPIQSQVYMNLADLPQGIEANEERGLLDFALDPNFPASPYIYVFYTPQTLANGQKARVSRFTHSENGGALNSRGNLNSELVIWEDSGTANGLYEDCCHFGGGLDFGPDGNLWLTTGEHFQSAYATNLQKGGGKIHRFTKTGAVPAGNPYADGAGGNMDTIFAYGLRNPFRARWDLPSGRFFIGEVGGNTQTTAWEDLHVLRYDLPTGRYVDSDFGTGSDNGVYNGINYGWPTVEGLPPHTDFPGAVISPNVGEPIFGWKHNGDFSAITGGVVYRGNDFPAEYVGAYFYADSTRGLVRYLKFNANGSIAANPSPVPIDYNNPDLISYPFDLFPNGRVVAMEVGPDGALYYASFSDGTDHGNSDPTILGAVRRYVYDGGNARPTISQFSAAPSSGPAPLAVTFSIKAVDPEGNAMTRSIDFGDGTAVTAPVALPGNTTVTVAHTYQSAGSYVATLYVSDPTNTAATQTASITVGTPPVITSLTSSNSRPGSTNNMFRFGDTIHFAAAATNGQGVPLTGSSFTWSVAFIRPGTTHPAFGPATGTTAVDFLIPTQGQGFSGPVYYRCFLTVTDSSGLSTVSTIDVFPEKSNITLNTVPSGIIVQVAGDTARIAPYVLDSLINFNQLITVPLTVVVAGHVYQFSNWSNGPTSVQQLYNVPVSDSSLTANYIDLGPSAVLPASGLVMHLDGSAGVTESGGSVSSWNDQTANHNDLAAVGAPSELDLVLNGQNAIHFDGSSDALARTGFTGLPTGSADRSVFMVVRYDSANPLIAGWGGFTYGSASNNAAFGLVLTPFGQLGVQAWGGGGNDILSSPATNGVGQWLTQSAVVSGGSLSQFANGANIGTTAHTFATGTGGIRLGEELNGGRNVDMDVAEVVVYNRAVSLAERQQIETYFAQRYALSSGSGNNTAPVVTITAPANNAVFTTAQMPVTLTATATDAENGDVGSSIVWSSSLDGALGSAASISRTLSTGTHVLTATATDLLGLPGSANITVTVTAPADSNLVTSGLVFHLESDSSVQLQSGTTTVTKWLDKAFHGAGIPGNDMAAFGSPKLGLVSTPTGKPAITLNGTGDKLERIDNPNGQPPTPLTADLPMGNTDRTMFVLAKYNSASAWAGVVYGTGAPNEAFGLVVTNSSTLELALSGWGSGNDLVSTVEAKNAGWLVHSGLVTGGKGTLFKDGTQIGQFTHTYDTGDNSPDPTLTKMVIGQEIGQLGYVGLDIAAVLIYNRALNSTERASVEAYLRNKYIQNTAPTVAISAPANLSTHSLGAPIAFTAAASDVQDNGATLTAAIQWSSNLNGALGTGGSISTSALSLGTHTITASVTDSGSLSGSASITITVGDTTPPVITRLGASPMQVSVGGTFTDPGATATDNVDGSLTAQIMVSGGPVVTTAPGSFTLTYNVSDTAGNAATPVTRTVNVVDQTPPVIALVGANPLVVAVGGTFTDPGATATDNVDGSLTAQIVVSGGPVVTSAPGSFTLTYNVSDAAGNAAVAVTRTVNVVDQTPPVLTVPANQTAEATSATGAVVAYPSASATDNVTALPLIGYSAASGSVFPLGTTTVNVTASDGAGNVANGSFTVTVVDTTAPVITLTGANPLIVLAGETFVDPGAMALDLVDGDVTASIVAGGQAVNINTPGSYDLTYTVSDSRANTSEKQRTVLVAQLAAPELQFVCLHNETDDTCIKFDSVYGLDYELHTSTELDQWDLLDTISGDGFAVEMIHTGGANGPRRFYKVVVKKSGQ